MWNLSVWKHVCSFLPLAFLPWSFFWNKYVWVSDKSPMLHRKFIWHFEALFRPIICVIGTAVSKLTYIKTDGPGIFSVAVFVPTKFDKDRKKEDLDESYNSYWLLLDSTKCVVKRALSVQGADECVTQRVPGHKGKGGTGAKWRAPNHSPLPWGSLRLPSPLHPSLSSNKALHDDYPSMKT